MKVLQKLGLYRFLILLACLFATHAAALAGIRPSFLSQDSAWQATDIVVVTEGTEIDGVVQVIEVLKGELKPGATLTLPELGEFKPKEARRTHKFEGYTSVPDQFVTGNKLMLFLRDQTKIPAGDDQDNFGELEQTSSRWSGANPMGREVRYSTVWIEGEKTYAFYQLVNPGPSLLTHTLTEAALRKLIVDVSREQAAVNNAAAVVEPAERAEKLRPFIHSSIYFARKTAFIKLSECGTAALPVLRAEFESIQDQDLLTDVIKAMAKAGGREAGPVLTKFLAGELEFWRQTAPTLQPGWWNGAGFGPLQLMDVLNAQQRIRDRWSTLLNTVNALREIRYAESANVIADLNELWRSLPQMSGDQVGEACDDYFRTVGRTAIAKNRLALPKYEIQFSGNKIFSSEELTRKMAEYMAQFDQLDQDYKSNKAEGIFDYALSQLYSFVWSQGYVYARFKSLRRATARGESIAVEMEEGVQYRMCELKIEGARLVSAEQIRSTFPLRTGEVVNKALIDKWASDVERSHFRLGYLNAYVEINHKPRSKSASDDMLGEFKIRITEGDQFTVDSIKFNGKSKYSESRLAGVLSMRSGEKFTEASLESGIEKLNKQFGLELDREKDVELVRNNRTSSVTIMIFLNRDRGNIVPL